jgi:hypothetical protein
MRTITFILLCFFCSFNSYCQSGELAGKVFDKNSKEIIDDANIAVYYGDSLFTKIISDFSGQYSVKNLPAGKITVICSKDSFATLIEKNIPVHLNKTTTVDFSLRKTSRSNDIDLVEYKGADAPKTEEPVKEIIPVPTDFTIFNEPITLFTDSDIVKGSIKQGYYYKIGSRDTVPMKFLAGNLAFYIDRNPEASKHLHKYIRNKAWKLGLQIGFGTLAGLYAGSYFFDKDNQEFFSGYRAVLLGGAVACIGISALIDEGNDKHLRKSVQIYNASLR